MSIICTIQFFPLSVVLSFVILFCRIANAIDSECNVIVYNNANDTTVIDPSRIADRCSERMCVRKCCPLNYVFSRQTKQCRPKMRNHTYGGSSNNDNINNNNNTSVVTDLEQTEEETYFKKRIGRELRSVFIDSSNISSLLTVYGYSQPNFYLKSDKFSVLPNGSLRMLMTNQLKNASDYCLDEASEDGKLTAWICRSKDIVVKQQTVPDLHYKLYAVCMLISLICLLCTFAIYCLEEFQNLHGRCLKQYLSSLIISYSLMIVLSLRYVDFEDRPYCYLIGILAQFLILASFFWLNVMCFDLWRTFRQSRTISNTNGNKKFLNYFIYAWGCPCCITIVELIIEYVPGIPDWIIKPKFGQNSCWFEDGSRFYLYVPIGLILLTNTVMFISTILAIIGNNKNSKYLNRNSSGKQNNVSEIKRFNICFKLYIVMGLNWIMEVLSWYFDGQSFLWCIPDICNALQGLLIFFIFVFKGRVLRIINVKFGIGKPTFTRTSRRSVWSTTTSITSNPHKSIKLHILPDERY